MARTIVLVAALLAPAIASAAPGPGDAIWKLQLRIRVADVSNAGTDADIRVKFNTTNSTWIDSMANDFERNSDRLHYLLQTGLPAFGHITYLEIYHNSTDAICFRSLELIANGVTLYKVDYGTSGKWLQNGFLMISPETLVANSYWKNYVTPPLPDKMMFRTLENRIEAAWGHMMKGTKCKWDDGDVYALNPVNWAVAPYYISKAQRIPDYNADGTLRRQIRYPFFTKALVHSTATRVAVTNKRVKDNAFDQWCTSVFELDMKIVNGKLEMTYHDMTGEVSETAFEYTVWGIAQFVKAVAEMFTGGAAETVIGVVYYLSRAMFHTQTVSEPVANSFVSISFPVKPGATKVVKKQINGEWWFCFE